MVKFDYLIEQNVCPLKALEIVDLEAMLTVVELACPRPRRHAKYLKCVAGREWQTDDMGLTALELMAFGQVNPESDRQTLSQGAVNYARHNLTTYDTCRRNAPDGGCFIYGEMALAWIAQQWPDLAAECGRQAYARGTRA